MILLIQSVEPSQPQNSHSTSRTMAITCLYTNADQLQSKMEELYVNEYIPTLVFSY